MKSCNITAINCVRVLVLCAKVHADVSHGIWVWTSDAHALCLKKWRSK